MSTSIGKARCVTCEKENSTVSCDGCSQRFCFDHLGNHRQELGHQLDEVEVEHDLFRQTLIEQSTDPKKHVLIQEINRWEKKSIKKIRETAEEARRILSTYTAAQVTEIEVNLNKLTNQLRKSRDEKDFVEEDLQQWKEQLTRLNEDLTKFSNVTLRQDSTPLVTKIHVDLSPQICIPNITINTTWTQNGVTVCGGNKQGNGHNQIYNPLGLYVGEDQTIYIADYANHRIMEWKSGATSGRVVAGGNGQGNGNNQLNNPRDVIIDKERDSLIISDHRNRRVVLWPRRNGASGQTIISNVDCWGLAIDNNGSIYIADYNKNEVKRWKVGDTSGTVVAGGNGQGNRLDQLNGPDCIFVDQNHSVYVSDNKNHRVMKWKDGAKEGVVVAGGQGPGNGLTQLNYPYGIVVDQMDTVYVADYSNHRVMRWPKGASEGTVVVGANGQGGEVNQFYGAFDLTFDRQNNLYVADYNNHRVQKFNINPSSNT